MTIARHSLEMKTITAIKTSFIFTKLMYTASVESSRIRHQMLTHKKCLFFFGLSCACEVIKWIQHREWESSSCRGSCIGPSLLVMAFVHCDAFAVQEATGHPAQSADTVMGICRKSQSQAKRFICSRPYPKGMYSCGSN